MSNMGSKVAVQEVNYVTLHDEVRIRNEAMQLEALIKEVLAKASVPTRTEFDALSKKIDDLSVKLGSLRG